MTRIMALFLVTNAEGERLQCPMSTNLAWLFEESGGLLKLLLQLWLKFCKAFSQKTQMLLIWNSTHSLKIIKWPCRTSPITLHKILTELCPFLDFLVFLLFYYCWKLIFSVSVHQTSFSQLQIRRDQGDLVQVLWMFIYR